MKQKYKIYIFLVLMLLAAAIFVSVSPNLQKGAFQKFTNKVTDSKSVDSSAPQISIGNKTYESISWFGINYVRAGFKIKNTGSATIDREFIEISIEPALVSTTESPIKSVTAISLPSGGLASSDYVEAYVDLLERDNPRLNNYRICVNVGAIVQCWIAAAEVP